jgi:hypothetical protein
LSKINSVVICSAIVAETFLGMLAVIFPEIDAQIPVANERQYLRKNEDVLSGNMCSKSCVNNYGKISH